MIEKVFTVQNKLGVHVRVACDILQIAKENDCKVFARKISPKGANSESVEIKFPLALVSMQARFKEVIEIGVSGESEDVEILVIGKIEEILNDEALYN